MVFYGKVVFTLTVGWTLLTCNPDSRNGQQGEKNVVKESIKEVYERHTKELMSVDGVVGTAIGAQEDGTPCILVFVTEFSEEIKSRIPSSIDGYPVAIQVSGKIVPMR